MDLNQNTKLTQKPIIAFAIVVFREKFYETTAFQSLTSCFLNLEKKHDIYIYDNTDLEGWSVDFTELTSDLKVLYHHNKLNPGISVAYNYVACQANKNGVEWLVFLDQDTEMPTNAASVYMSSICRNPESPIKVPIIMVGGTQFSPFKVFFKRSRLIKSFPPCQVMLGKHSFINSGMLAKLAFFFAIGGYDENVKLDFSDSLFIDRICKKRDSIEVLDLFCQHNFSYNEKNKKKAILRFSIFLHDLNACPKNFFKDRLQYFFVGILHAMKLSKNFRSLIFLKMWVKQVVF